MFSQLKQDASLGTLVKTVEENVRIPITAWNVKISATVMRTDVISQPDVQIIQKVTSPCTLIVINNKLYFQMIRTSFLYIELLIFYDECLPIEMYFTSMT